MCPASAVKTSLQQSLIRIFQALARGIASLRDMPAPEDALAAHGADPDDSFEDLDYNPYDGMSPDDAAAHCEAAFYSLRLYH